MSAEESPMLDREWTTRKRPKMVSDVLGDETELSKGMWVERR